MSARKGKVIDNADVRVDQWGATCGRCLEPAYLDAIRKGKPVYRHVSKTPWAEGCKA